MIYIGGFVESSISGFACTPNVGVWERRYLLGIHVLITEDPAGNSSLQLGAGNVTIHVFMCSALIFEHMCRMMSLLYACYGHTIHTFTFRLPNCTFECVCCMCIPITRAKFINNTLKSQCPQTYLLSRAATPTRPAMSS